MAFAAAFTLTSCVSKQKYVELEELQNATSDKLSNAKMELAAMHLQLRTLKHNSWQNLRQIKTTWQNKWVI